jgi:hypothetical protein
MMPSVVILHPLQLPAGRDLSGHTSPKALPGSTYYSKAEYANTQHERLLATGFLLLKINKEYVLTFKILAQVLVGLIFTELAI